VRLTPRCSWDAKQEAIFVAECKDFERIAQSNTKTKNMASVVDNNSFSQKSLKTASSASKTKLSDSFLQLSKAQTAAATTQRNTAVASPNRSAQLMKTTADTDAGIEKEPNEKDAIFTFDFNEYKCNVLDHQYNSFDIDLSPGASPLDPKVVLSGEVSGLKPPAVADRPMEPRLFVVNRAAEATELLSSSAISSMETLLRTCSDTFKTSISLPSQPSDLGPSHLHKYFVPRRLLGNVNDNFTFSEIFGARSWHPCLDNAPAAALLYIRTCANNSVSNSSRPPPPRYFDVFTVTEKTPLSSEGHGYLQKAIDSCDLFRAARLKSIDRFKVEEDRSHEELEEEELLAKRLRGAFKNAKAAVAKRKEQKALAQHNNSAIIENLNEDAEDDDESNSYFDDDAPVEVRNLSIVIIVSLLR